MAMDNQNTMQAKLARLLERERAITAQASKLKKEMAQMDRKNRTQYLITLGTVLEAFGEQCSQPTRAVLQGFIDSRRALMRATDIEILNGTPWAVNVPTAPTQPSRAPEVNHESGYTEQE